MSLAQPTPPPATDPTDWLVTFERAERRGVEELGRRAVALERLLAVSSEIATLDLDAALDRILRAVLDLSATRRAALLLLQPDGSLACARALGWPSPDDGPTAPAFSQSLVAQALATGTVSAVENMGLAEEQNRTSAVRLGLRALVAIPLRSQRETLGALYLDTDAEEGTPGPRFDPSLLAAFGAQAAIALENARLYRRLEEENLQLQRALGSPLRCGEILYRSAGMDRVCRAVGQVAGTDVTVLVLGETGTGKELVARALHSASRRSGGRFLAQNMGALPDELLESELFGHRRGAFSGAIENKAGLFEAADGGTVLLDEIGDASPALQIRLLRLLETRTFRRLGETADRRTTARVVAATHRDLEAEVRAGRFRADLFYRLNVFPIQVPPLRERREDVAVLVPHLVEKANAELGRSVRRIPPAVLAALVERDWPGNVRELANAVQRLVLLSPGEELVGPGPAPAREGAEAQVHTGGALRPLAEVEREHLRQALEATGGNLSRAAALLGLKRGTLRWRLRKHGLG